MKRLISGLRLTAAEKKIEKERTEGKYIPVSNVEDEKKKLMQAANLPAKKTKRITIRLQERTVEDIKNKAAKEGIPYQTLIGSILHKYVNA